MIAAMVTAPMLFAACNGKHTAPKATLETSHDTLAYEMGMAYAPSEAELKMYLSDPRTGSDSLQIEAFMEGMREGLEAAKDKKQAAYIAGLTFGTQLSGNLTQVEKMVFGNDSTKHLSRKNLIAGFMTAYEGKKTALLLDGKPADKMAAQQDLNTRMDRLSQEAFERDHAEDKKKSEAAMAQKAKEAGVNKLPGGTLYKVLTEGTGAKAKEGQTVNVIYEGRLENGEVFAAPAQHPGADGKSTPMVVGRLVPGFNEALKAMPAGSKWEITIPYDQAYGARGGGPFPAFSNLTFTVEVVSIEETPNAEQ